MGKFSFDSTVREVLADRQAVAILEKYIPGVSRHPMIMLVQNMRLRELFSMVQGRMSKEKLVAIERELRELK